MRFPRFFTNYQTLASLDIKSSISKLNSTDKPQEDFLFSAIQDWRESGRMKYMLTAQDYYGNDNDINDRKRYYIDRKGQKVEATNLSNSKLSHPYFRKLVNQKVNRLLSKPFTVKTEDKKAEELLGTYFNKAFMRKLKIIGRDAIINGLSWVQVYYDEKGKLGFKRIPTEELIPFWADADHTELSGIIRVYNVMNYLKNGTKKEVVKIEYHTTSGVWYYILGRKGLEPDLEHGIGPKGHFVVNKVVIDEEGNQKIDEKGVIVTENISATWEKVPFIAFKYNPEETSLLKWVKGLIDDYDINTSDTSNNLQDIPNSIKVVKDFDGTDKEEFTHNLNVFRTAFVSGDGDMHSLETKFDVATIDSHLNRLRKDIYDAGSGVDMQEKEIGTASGVALKLRFSDLDDDVADLANELQASFEQLIWFIQMDALNNNLGDLTKAEIELEFNTDTIVNEQELVTECKDSVGLVSNETILSKHPFVTDVQAEMEKVKAEKAQAIKDFNDLNGGGDGGDGGGDTSGFGKGKTNNNTSGGKENVE